MSDKKGHHDSESASLLKKKTSRKKKTVSKLEKEFDLKKFRDKIFDELNNDGETMQAPQDFQTLYEYSNEYEKRYKEYLQEGFSYNTLMFVNRIIIESTSLPPSLRTNFALHKILMGVVKTLMMNELEIVYLSLYLDKMGWTTEGYQLDENLLITGISVKMYLNQNYIYIIEHLSRKMKIEERFNAWLTIKKDYYNSMTIAPRELNERFKLLSKPFDTYCKQNYIDYNFIVDQILQMSLPYSEGKHTQEKLGTVSHEHTFYEPSVHIIKQPETQQTGYAGLFPVKDEAVAGQNLNNPNLFENYGPNFPKQHQETSKPILDNNVMNNNTSAQIQMNLNNAVNFGRIDSLNNFLRDGSFYNWENNNDRFLPSRGPSQLFGQYPDEDEAKNFFSKANAFKNNQIPLNDLSPPNISNLYNSANSLNTNLSLPSYPTKKFSIDNINPMNASHIKNPTPLPSIDIKSNLIKDIKEEFEHTPGFINNKSFSFENKSKITSQDRDESNEKVLNIQSSNKPLLKLDVSGVDNNKIINLFKKMKEEQQK